MNTNEHESDPRASLRQKLVAVLLGEASVEEKAEVERALAANPELGAEHARLAATIGLVQGLKGADAGAQLSPAASERLADAAAQRAVGPRPLTGPQSFARPEGVRRAWYASPVFRMAASIALLAGAFAAWRASEGSAESSKGKWGLPAKELQASLEKDGRDSSQLDAKNQIASAGEAGTALGVAPPASAPAPAESAPPVFYEMEQSVRGETPPDKEAAAAAQMPAGEEILGDRLRQLDALEGQDGAKKSEVAALAEATEKLNYGVDRNANGSLDAKTASEVPAGSTAPSKEPWAGAGGGAGGNGEFAAKPIGESYSGGHYGTGTPSVFAGRSAGGGRKNGEAASQRASQVPPGELARTELPAAAAPEIIDRSSVASRDDGEAKALLEQLGYAGAPSKADEIQDRLRALQRLGYTGNTDRFGDRDQSLRALEAARQLSPAERAALIDQLIGSCRRRPQERPRDMFYRWWGDNAFEWARTDPLSTFSVDVDTASYTLARRYLAERMLPEKAQIRTEEFVNYFKGDVPPPSEATFRVATELAPSLFNSSPDTWMLRVALRGREVSRTERKPVALTFVVDVSGSMRENDRLELVKHALRLLVSELDARDTISIVAFTNDARLVLPATSARDRGLIESAIHPLQPEGGTNVQAGLRMGYEAALAQLVEGATNRVVLLSDGVGNIGETDAAAINSEVERQRGAGIYLNTVGVGMNNHNDAFLEQLADKGDGMCNYVDDEREARRALVDNFTGAFEPIASDVKIQVEFDPSQVERYRLLGYENRAVADRDFRNDAVDAGEVGAGHQVVALYEVVRTGRSDSETPLATVRVRWKPPVAAGARAEAPMAQEIAQPVHASQASGSFAATSAGYRRSVLVGQLAEFLRRSIHSRDDRFDVLLAESRKLAPELADPDFDEFVRMVERTIDLITVEWGRYDGLAKRLDDLRMQHYLRAEIEALGGERSRLDELDRQIGELEAEVRGLCERGSLVR